MENKEIKTQVAKAYILKIDLNSIVISKQELTKLIMDCFCTADYQDEQWSNQDTCDLIIRELLSNSYNNAKYHKIKTTEQYESYLKRIEEILDVSEKENVHELRLLSSIVSEYEDANFKLPEPNESDIEQYNKDMKSLTKVSLSLNNKSLDNVNKLSCMLGEDNKTRVVSTALKITKTILEYLADDNKIIVRALDGSEKNLSLK